MGRVAHMTAEPAAAAGQTLTFGDLLVAEQSLPALCALKLSGKAAYHLSKVARFIAEELKHFHETRNRYVTELGMQRPDGAHEVAMDSPNYPEFARRINELTAVIVEMTVAPIALEEFGDNAVAARDLLALGALLAEPKE